MEVIFSLAGLAFGLFLLFCPVVALVMALNAHSRITLLEQTAGELKEKLSRLACELADAKPSPPSSSDDLTRPVEAGSEPVPTLSSMGEGAMAVCLKIYRKPVRRVLFQMPKPQPGKTQSLMHGLQNPTTDNPLVKN